MNDSKRGILAGALLGDALTLGAHWMYDTAEIVEKFGNIDGYSDPAKNPYHNNKKIGDFTHYGDQMVILIESIKREGGYNPEKYMQSWVDTMKNYTGYMDHATKVTLDTVAKTGDILHSGSPSFDASVIGRIAPLLALRDGTTHEEIADFVRFTHNHETVVSGTLFIADVIAAVQSGKTPHEAISQTASNSTNIETFRDLALETTTQDTTETIKKFGQSCGIDGVFQGALHCILKYESDFHTALIENTKAGGDSAARGMIIGMVLGASLGYEKLPVDWIETMNYKVG